MAFRPTAHLKGSDTSYRIHPECKPYTLRDHNFVTTAAKNYQYNRLVKVHFDDPQGVHLVIKVNKDLSGLDMTVTNNAGLKAIDIYTDPQYQTFQTPVAFILQTFVDEHVLAEA